MAEEESEAPAENPAEGGDEAGDGKKSKKKLIIFAAIGVLLIGGIGVGAAMFLGGGGEESSGAAVSAEGSEAPAEGATGEAPPAEDKPAEEAAGEGGEAAPAEAPPEKKAAESDGEKKPDIDFGDTYKMNTFHLNLGNALENRYVRLEVTLEYTGGEAQKAEIEKRLPQLRDAVISIVTRKTREFLLAPDGKDALRKEILIRVNRYMKTKIDTVYITDILIE